jgi:hypothetical protein
VGEIDQLDDARCFNKALSCRCNWEWVGVGGRGGCLGSVRDGNEGLAAGHRMQRYVRKFPTGLEHRTVQIPTGAIFIPVELELVAASSCLLRSRWHRFPWCRKFGLQSDYLSSATSFISNLKFSLNGFEFRRVSAPVPRSEDLKGPRSGIAPSATTIQSGSKFEARQGIF